MPVLAFLSMLDDRKVLHRQVVAQVRSDRRFGLTAVPVSAVGGAHGHGADPRRPRLPRNLAAVAYRRLWAEVEDRVGLDAPARIGHRPHPAEATAVHAG